MSSQNAGDQLAGKIELYKIFVDTAERNIERRMRINQFYFSIVAALFIAYSYLLEGKLGSTDGVTAEMSVRAAKGANSGIVAATPFWVLPLVLVVISMSWYSVLLSFRALSTAKYRVIGEMEKELPLQPFAEEWKQYKAIRKIETSQLELALPILFYIAGVAGVIAPFFWQ